MLRRRNPITSVRADPDRLAQQKKRGQKVEKVYSSIYMEAYIWYTYNAVYIGGREKEGRTDRRAGRAGPVGQNVLIRSGPIRRERGRSEHGSDAVLMRNLDVYVVVGLIGPGRRCKGIKIKGKRKRKR